MEPVTKWSPKQVVDWTRGERAVENLPASRSPGDGAGQELGTGGACPLLRATKQTSAERPVRPYVVRLLRAVPFGGGARSVQRIGHPYLSQGTTVGWPFRERWAGHAGLGDLAPGHPLCPARVPCRDLLPVAKRRDRDKASLCG